MQEVHGFVDRPCIDELRLDVSSFFTDPAGFGYRLRSSGGGAKDAQHMSEILTERSVIFMSLGQPARALRDLECAAELGDELAVPEADRARQEVERINAESHRLQMARRVPITVLTGFSSRR